MKSLYHFFYLFIAFFFSNQTIITAPPSRRVIKHILCAMPHISNETFSRIVSKEYREISQLRSHARVTKLHKMTPILISAIANLHAIPGLEETLHVIFKTTHLPSSGELYELEKALEIITKNNNPWPNETLLSLSRQIKLSQEPTRAYFDLITSRRFIECKAINWNYDPTTNCPLTTKLQAQFQRQQKTVLRINQHFGTSYHYEIHSKHKVPGSWHEWFTTNGISIVEEKN